MPGVFDTVAPVRPLGCMGTVAQRLGRIRALAAWLPQASPLKARLMASLSEFERGSASGWGSRSLEVRVAILEQIASTAFLLDPEPDEALEVCCWGPSGPSLGGVA